LGSQSELVLSELGNIILSQFFFDFLKLFKINTFFLLIFLGVGLGGASKNLVPISVYCGKNEPEMTNTVLILKLQRMSHISEKLKGIDSFQKHFSSYLKCLIVSHAGVVNSSVTDIFRSKEVNHNKANNPNCDFNPNKETLFPKFVLQPISFLDI
jgi:hypothetical protein